MDTSYGATNSGNTGQKDTAMGQPTKKKGHGKGTVGVSAKKIVMNRVCFEQIC